jgi:hypothetical protein
MNWVAETQTTGLMLIQTIVFVFIALGIWRLK